jgi:hypothetical protein
MQLTISERGVVLTSSVDMLSRQMRDARTRRRARARRAPAGDARERGD